MRLRYFGTTTIDGKKKCYDEKIFNRQKLIFLIIFKFFLARIKYFLSFSGRNGSVFLNSDAGIHGPPNRSVFFHWDAGIHEPPNRSIFWNWDAGIHEPPNRSIFWNWDARIYEPLYSFRFFWILKNIWNQIWKYWNLLAFIVDWKLVSAYQFKWSAYKDIIVRGN